MTLHELVVAVAVMGVVFAGAYGSLDAGLRVYAIGAARAESQQSARVSLSRLAREIRVTGVGADIHLPAIAAADSAAIVLASDLDADGALATRGERITWHLGGSTLRRDAGGGAQPVANGVQRLAFRYLDADGAPTTDPAAVRRVEITVLAASPGAESSLARGVSTHFGTEARLRNR